MATKLLIVESPGKIKKLSQILGSDWLVKASMGHVRELASDGQDALGFDLTGSTVTCRFVLRSGKGQQTIKQLQAAVRQVKTVFLATDCDREGETIAWHLQQALHLKNPQRVVYTEITPASVKNALSHPRQLDQNMVNAGLCRSVLDKLVGYKGSPLLWQLQNGAKSMGRVQSATLHILCQREQQIKAFVPQDYWNVYVNYVEGFRAYYLGTNQQNDSQPSETPLLDDTSDTKEQTNFESSKVLSAAHADSLVQQAKVNQHQIVSTEGKSTTRTPPPAFVTSSLQQAAGTRLKFSPEKTMLVAQSLYESGLITYMRTDSIALAPEFCAAVRSWLEVHDPNNVPKTLAQHRQVKGAQAAHEAIRPTDIQKRSADLRVQLSADAFALYVMIWKRSVASGCQNARIRQTRIVTQSGNIFWQAKGQLIEFPGYTKYWNNISADVQLPSLRQGQILTLQQALHEQKQTQPPPRYSEPKLVQVMERKGIGRPSTYAATIQTLKQRQYAELIKGHLQPTKLGLEVDCFLADALPDLLQTEFTAEMENQLDAISSGKQDWQKYLTAWNRDYFVPAIAKAKQFIPRHLSNQPAVQFGGSLKQLSSTQPPTKQQSGQHNQSRTRCPQCQNYLVKIPSSKLKKKHFLKCVSGCTDVVMFWSERDKKWQLPQKGQTNSQSVETTNAQITQYSCPICQKLLEEYRYQKEGLAKSLLRCSDSKARSDSKHKEAVYFHTTKGWWSPKFGELP
ncbi:type I DNA topoisomerase [Chlorogloea sp. CCALA 695]|uniref:type I DNA topoisomerase n=1 Tax=Chlorogloea sp. CCALA 695 TaxID=2107693 RepID=UPI000D0760F6|nr:type I DNA topoisomerase [Chlorogloea sp. CCALA 695]PSB27685.1 type I DNA topoisomerase [Chlorogloea sp. CCALA 695]